MEESNKKIYILNNQLIDEKNKNNILSKEILDLNNKMEESNKKINILNNQLANEKNKNNILLKDNSNYKNKVEELNSKINKHNNNQKIIPDDIIKLYKKIDDLNEKLKRFPFILEENEKLISSIISSINRRINFSMFCKNTFTINDLEKELYKEYPEISEAENYFMCKGNIINKFKTFESNHIKDGDILILNQKEN